MNTINIFQPTITGGTIEDYREGFRRQNSLALKQPAYKNFLSSGNYHTYALTAEAQYFRFPIRYVRHGKQGINQMTVVTINGETVQIPVLGGVPVSMVNVLAILVGGDFIATDQITVDYERTTGPVASLT